MISYFIQYIFIIHKKAFFITAVTKAVSINYALPENMCLFIYYHHPVKTVFRVQYVYRMLNYWPFIYNVV